MAMWRMTFLLLIAASVDAFGATLRGQLRRIAAGTKPSPTGDEASDQVAAGSIDSPMAIEPLAPGGAS